MTHEPASEPMNDGAEQDRRAAEVARESHSGQLASWRGSVVGRKCFLTTDDEPRSIPELVRCRHGGSW